MSKTLLIVGLGNPGKQYESTRHNAGFMAAEAIAYKLGMVFSAWQGAKAEYAKGSLGDTAIYILKPLTFMNLSGTAVSSFSHFFKIQAKDIIVIFDDMSISLGDIRMRLTGSAGGQNGMKNIIEQLGTQDVPRLRIGIGPRPEYFEGKDFVLSKFNTADRTLLDSALLKTVSTIEEVVRAGYERAQNFANTKTV